MKRIYIKVKTNIIARNAIYKFAAAIRNRSLENIISNSIDIKDHRDLFEKASASINNLTINTIENKFIVDSIKFILIQFLAINAKYVHSINVFSRLFNNNLA